MAAVAAVWAAAEDEVEEVSVAEVEVSVAEMEVAAEAEEVSVAVVVAVEEEEAVAEVVDGKWSILYLLIPTNKLFRKIIPSLIR